MVTVANRNLSSGATLTQRLPAALTPFDVALRSLIDGLQPVVCIDTLLAHCVGVTAAEIALLQVPHSAVRIAVSDGWALRARDTVGASSYSPVPMAAPPLWVEAGDRLPVGCNCVLDAEMVEKTGPLFQIVAEAIPGQGLRRAADNVSNIPPGRLMNLFDVLAARGAGIDRIQVRSPRVGIIDVPSADGSTATSRFVQEFATASGARAVWSQAGGRDAASIHTALSRSVCDLIVTVGGTGLGRTDATIEALAVSGCRLMHGLALEPGRTAAVGKIDTRPIIAAPGASDQALAVCLMLLQPALDRLSKRSPRHAIVRPLARKISSSIGVAEIVLLGILNETWVPIAVGQLSLEAIGRAEAWLAVPGNSEGYAAGTEIGAFFLRDVI